MNKNKRWFNYSVYDVLFLCSFFLCIIFPIFPSIFKGEAYHVLVISFIPFFLMPLYLRISKKTIAVSFSFLFLFLFLTVVSVFNDGFSISDLFSGVKIIYFYIYFLFGYFFALNNVSAMSSFVKCYFLLLYLSFFISLVEIFFPEISYLFYKRSNIDILSDKLTSIFNTTYHYAFFLFWGYVYKLVQLLYKLKYNVGDSSVKVILAEIFIISFLMLMTQSRMFFISCFVVMLFSVLFFSFLNLKRSIPIVGVVLFSLIVSVFFIDQIIDRFYYISNGLIYLFQHGVDFSGNGTGSFNTRINQIIFSLDSIKEHPLWGSGIGKGIYLESIYAYLLYKYGISGLVLYFLMLFSIVRISNKARLISENINEKIFFMTCFIFFLMNPIYLLNGPLFEVPKLSMYFFCLIGILIGLKTKLCNNKIKYQG